MCEEKRKFKRYRGKEGAFAAFIRPNELINMGQIHNISMGGLAVRYLATNKKVLEEDADIKIFGSNERFIHVDKVKCRIVYDRELPEHSWAQISTRLCGIEFENLSVRHLSTLEEFITNFTFNDA